MPYLSTKNYLRPFQRKIIKLNLRVFQQLFKIRRRHLIPLKLYHQRQVMRRLHLQSLKTIKLSQTINETQNESLKQFVEVNGTSLKSWGVGLTLGEGVPWYGSVIMYYATSR